MTRPDPHLRPAAAPDTATYVEGLDFVLDGGIPTGRTTLVVGGPGCGKSTLASEFIIRGAERGEAGLFVSFDETPAQIGLDLASFDMPLARLQEEGLVGIHQIAPEDACARSTGPFTLDGLFLQLESLLSDLRGARRIALDSLDSFFGAVEGEPVFRRELRRLFHWLGDRGVTSLVTAEKGGEGLTRLGLEAYLSDCVILLDYRVEKRIATRRARVLKRRGGGHSGDEHPFLISDRGIRLLPLTNTPLTHDAPTERMSSGISGLDEMLGPGGYYRGSSILISGTPGAGKSTLAAAFVDGACRRGETAIYYSFEESPKQIVRNMRSVGYDLGRWLDEGLLHIGSRRPSAYGLESHLIEMDQAVHELKPNVVVMDPFTSLSDIGFEGATRSMMIRLVDLLKRRNVTGLYTALETDHKRRAARHPQAIISSLMDTLIVLEGRRLGGLRRRFVWVLKARGAHHDAGIRELEVGDDGVRVVKAGDLARGERG